MGPYLRGMAGFLIGFAVLTLALQLTAPRMSDPFISVQPPTLTERLLRVLVAGTIAMIAGAVTAVIAGSAARIAALGLTAVCTLSAAADLATRDTRELSAVIALFVVPPCCLLGAELTPRRVTTGPPSRP